MQVLSLERCFLCRRIWSNCVLLVGRAAFCVNGSQAWHCSLTRVLGVASVVAVVERVCLQTCCGVTVACSTNGRGKVAWHRVYSIDGQWGVNAVTLAVEKIFERVQVVSRMVACGLARNGGESVQCTVRMPCCKTLEVNARSA